MPRSERTTLALTVETSPIDDPGSLIEVLQPAQPLLFMRGGNGFAAVGTALRLEFFGPDRIASAANAWQKIVASATIVDPVATPGTGLIALGSFSFSDRSSLPSVLIVPSLIVGRRDGSSWVTTVRTDENSAAASPEPGIGNPPHVMFTPGRMPPERYLSAVDAAIGRIDDGVLSKVVLAREMVGRLPEKFDVRSVLNRLADSYPDCWTFALDGLVGSSPETLVQVGDGSVSARVLAGSAARGSDPRSDIEASVALATSTKDLDEHEYAVQSVLTALRAHSNDVVASDQPFTVKLPNLWHLASDVEGTLTDHSTALDLIAALHPTAAVAGTPTTEALQLIEELEPFDRGRYAGPIGWVGADGDGEWAIALRCAQLSDSVVTAYAGAGVVAESVAERELAETSMKFRPVLDAFSFA